MDFRENHRPISNPPS